MSIGHSVDAATLMRALGQELSRCASRADRLQNLPVEWAHANIDNTIIRELQDLDLLVQELRSLSDFCRRLAEVEREAGGLSPQSIALAASEISVGQLAERVSIAAAARPPDAGEVELW